MNEIFECEINNTTKSCYTYLICNGITKHLPIILADIHSTITFVIKIVASIFLIMIIIVFSVFILLIFESKNFLIFVFSSENSGKARKRTQIHQNQ